MMHFILWFGLLFLVIKYSAGRTRQILLAILILGSLIALAGCNNKPEHSFVFSGYQQGHMVFETDGVTYLVTCEGSGRPPHTDAHAAEECRAILPFRGHILPPTYVVDPTGNGEAFIDIPSLDLMFDIDEAF